MSDSIGDMLTVIRNASSVGFPEIKVPFSRLKQAVLNVLHREGFLSEVVSYQDETSKRYFLKIRLKYGPEGEKVIQHIARISKPGRRAYLQSREIPRVRNGYGVMILTTPKGVLSGKEARLQKIGGEAICEVW